MFFLQSADRVARTIFPGLMLTILAAIPRIITARTADLGPDEPIYISSGLTYVRLLFHFDFANSGWLEEMQAPSLPRLFYGAFALVGERTFNADPVISARMASVIVGITTVVVLFEFGRHPFGNLPAFLGAAVLALNPWHVYWSSLAMLDPFLVLFITLSALLILRADRHPAWLLAGAASFGLAFSSKYSAALGLPALVVLALLSVNLQRRLTWQMIIGCPFIASATIFVANPAIWVDPWQRLFASVNWQLNHASGGHQSFFAGAVMVHSPWWVASFVVLAKNSIVVLAFTMVLIVVFVKSLRPSQDWKLPNQVALIWFALLLGGFSFLTIVAADHYILPMAPPLALCSALGCKEMSGRTARWLNIRHSAAGGVLIGVLLFTSAFGIFQFPQVEGFTNEFLRPENRYIPVATTGYRAAIAWIDRTQPSALVTVPYFPDGASWGIARDHSSIRIASAGQSPSGSAFVIYPAFYDQYHLIDPSVITEYPVVTAVGQESVVYAYIFGKR